MAKKNCHCCNGTGEETDRVKQGRALSGLRLRARISLRGMARALGISHTYLWQMEHGDPALAGWHGGQIPFLPEGPGNADLNHGEDTKHGT